MMDFGPFEILCAIAIVLLIAFQFLFTKSNFWKIRGVKGPEPIAFFGNMKDVIFLRMTVGQLLKKLYNDYPNEPLVGFFTSSQPQLLVKDPNLIKDVLIKDFSTFSDRGIQVHEKVDPLQQHLLTLETAKWRPIRPKLSPMFTSGKLKEMFYILIECGENLTKYLEKIADEPIKIREFTAKYTTDVIGSCVFGLQMNAISEKESEFCRMGRKVFEMDWWTIIKLRIKESTPWLYDLLAPIFYDYEMTNFFVNCMNQTIEYREKNNVRRNDFIDLLRDIKNNSHKLGDFEMSDTLMAAQGFVFFVAGFETSATTMSNALYELAQHQTIQDKLRQEILDELKKNDGVFKFDSIKAMTYLHKVFQETLRKYPPATELIRQSSKPYTFNGTKVSIPKNQKIYISMFAIHRDPSIYPDPETFDPERFNEETVKTRHPMHYLPFGDGPRHCIGARFAVYETKIGLIKMLQNYKVDICEKTEIPYAYSTASFLLTPKNEIYLKFTKIN